MKDHKIATAFLVLGLATAAATRAQAPAPTFTVLHSFTGNSSDGANPSAGLLKDIAGNLYCTTSAGGAGTCTTFLGSGCGTVFKLDASGNETVLYSFKGGSD